MPAPALSPRRPRRDAAAWLALLLLWSAAPTAAAEPQLLRLAYGAPADSPAHDLLLRPWAQRLPIASQGALKVALEPGAEPAALRARLARGEIDLAWLPAAEVLAPGAPALALELPFMAWPAEAVSQAAMDLQRRHGAAATDGLRVLLLHADASAVLHLRGAPPRRLEDLAGRAIHAPSGPLRAWLRAAGATAVAAPDPAAGLAAGVLDGAALSFAAAAPLGVLEHARFHGDAGRPPQDQAGRRPGLGTVLHALVMQAARYDALPAAARRALDESGGRELARQAGRTWDKLDRLRRRQATAAGQVFHSLPARELLRWRRLAEPVVEAWVAAAEARGHDGRALLHEARTLVAKHYVLMGEEVEARTRPGRGRGG